MFKRAQISLGVIMQGGGWCELEVKRRSKGSQPCSRR